MPRLAAIRIFPVKSLDAVSLPSTRIAAGTLENDRRFAIVDSNGRIVNGKRTDRIHSIRLPASFDVSRSAFERQLTDHFGFPVHLEEETEGGFPDDRDASGPTIVSTGTLSTVASWFPGLSMEDVRARFRANLEIGGVPPFWEDRLFGAIDGTVTFHVGPVTFVGVNPCQRCVVPSRDHATGAATPDFQRVFRARREDTLPSWAAPSRFNHFYRLAVNTRIPASENGKVLRVGDAVELS
jgi:MOSC domain-containing protein